MATYKAKTKRKKPTTKTKSPSIEKVTNPNHRRDFDLLLDDAVLSLTEPKKKPDD